MKHGYVTDIKKAAKDNDAFRNVVFTGANSQLVLMSLQPGEEIGMEVHDGDQVLYVVEGEGYVFLDGSRGEIEKASIVFVPAGIQHNVVSAGDEAMKLFTVYAPPQHRPGLVQAKKPSEPEKARSL